MTDRLAGRLVLRGLILGCALLGAPLGLGCSLVDPENQARGDVGPCPQSETSPVAWDEEISELGTSAEKAFGAAGSSCRAPFVWSASGLEAAALTAQQAGTEVEVDIRIDPDYENHRGDDGDPESGSEATRMLTLDLP